MRREVLARRPERCGDWRAKVLA
jgi:hypothetical protein